MTPSFVALFAGASGMCVVGLAVLAALRMMPLGRPSDETDAIRILLSVIGWNFVLVGVLGICHFLLPMGLGILLWMALILVMLMALNRTRVEKRKALLQMIELAVQRRIPLPTAAAAVANETGGKIGAQSAELAQRLQRGEPLDRVLLSLPGLVPRRTQALLVVGMETGSLDKALEEITTERESAITLDRWVSQLLYFVLLIFAAATVLTFVLIKVVPAFRTIFEDFGTELPRMTQLLIDISTLFITYGYLLLPFAILLFTMSVYTVLLYLGWIDWEPPIVSRITGPFDTATTLRALAITVDAKRPLLRTMQTLTAVYPKEWVRRRLAQVSGEMALGVDWCESLRDNRLIKTVDASLLRAAEKVGNLSWALRLAADGHERRLAYRLHLLLDVVSPLVLLTIASVVGFIVLALFMPLVKIVETLT